jgi:hypothetical protein
MKTTMEFPTDSELIREHKFEGHVAIVCGRIQKAVDDIPETIVVEALSRVLRDAISRPTPRVLKELLDRVTKNIVGPGRDDGREDGE